MSPRRAAIPHRTASRSSASTVGAAAVSLLLLIVSTSVIAQSPVGDVVRLADGMTFTEGPVWLARDHKLVFSDIPAAKLMEWSADAGLRPHRGADHPNGNAIDLRGRLITCEHGSRTILRREADGSSAVLAARHDGKRLNSPNDVAVHPDGSLWFTDPPWGLPHGKDGKELPWHGVFRIDAESGATRAVRTDLAMPNGIALSPDGQTLYVSDTGGHPSHPRLRDVAPSIRAWTIEDDALGEQRWSIAARSDGMCVDSLGNLYSTAADGVSVWSPEGERIGLIEVPEHPANVCFGGERFDRLFITARTSLYAVDMDVSGHRPTERGAVVAVGGGGTTDAIKARVLELAGPDAAVLVFAQASESPRAGPNSAKMWETAGAAKVAIADPRDPVGTLARVGEADVLWFGGGSQTRLMGALDARLIEAVRRRRREGAVVGGTSAGAAVLGVWMITGEAKTRSITRGGTPLLAGLGVVEDVIFDQHFLARRRFNRLFVATAENRRHVGVGVDERTAAIIRGRDLEVVGDGSVTIIDARGARVASLDTDSPLAAEGVTVHVLPAGRTLDLSPTHPGSSD